MTDMTANQTREATAMALMRRKRLISIAIPSVVVVYFIYIFFSFDVPGLADRIRFDNAAVLVSDAYSHKTHFTRDNRAGEFSAAVEGENKGAYPEGEWPEWVSIETPDRAVTTLPEGYIVVVEAEQMWLDVPGFGEVRTVTSRQGIDLLLPVAEEPDWINASRNRVTITTPSGRVTVTKAKTEVLRYKFGWELFFFTLDSPFYGKSFLELAALAVSGDQVVAGTPNIVAMADQFWHNRMWRHSDVAWALFETILMAFLGTMGAALFALPLGFLAASNFTPVRVVRFGLRRVFDLLRGVDGLIWTILLARAFGPGPLTGSLAILLTDTGTFGKTFSEALENVDKKQIEGVQSTGANTLQKYRFGVIPQITPVLISQVLYYLESNTRSATIIGAIVGGGIGLLLTQAIITQKDWEEVTYYVVLIVLVVMLMDVISGWLRGKLIGKQAR